MPEAPVAAELTPATPEVNAEVVPTTPPAGEAGAPQAPQNEGEHEAEKRKSGYQREREKRERAEEEARVLRKAVEVLTGGKKPEEPKPTFQYSALDPKDPEPDIEAFQELKDFLRAQNAWSVRQAKREIAHEQQQRDVQSSQRTVEQKWNESETTFAKDHADYEDVTTAALEAIDALKGSIGIPVIAQAITKAGPELLYLLGQNPDEIERLAGLEPIEVVMELGAMRGKLAKPATPANEATIPPPVSRAPKPVVPVTKPSVAVAPDIYDPKLPYKEFVKLREAQKKS